MDSEKPRALLSVWDKTGIVEFATRLADLGFEIIKSTDKGNNYTGRTNYFRIANDGKIGINKKQASFPLGAMVESETEGKLA